MIFLLGSYIFCISILAMYGMHRIVLVHAKRTPSPQKELPEAKEAYPSILIQVPLFNEANVVTRVIETVSKLEWPKEKLHIQILDDSTDETTQLAQSAVHILQNKGVSITYHHRSHRIGFKAGALKNGLTLHQADFVGIFDADFLPNSTFLVEMIPYFYCAEIGMVQARWEHINRNENLLTQLSSTLLDGHFLIEHDARYQRGCFFNFNGTAGIWRTCCIEDAGGWNHDTITEDLDLSYRAQLKGWKFVFIPEITAPAEVPADIHAFRLQQYRWAKGSIQTAKKLLGQILSSHISFKVKLESLFHLSANIGYPLCLIWLITLPWIAEFDGLIPNLWKAMTVIFGFFGVLYFYGHAMLRAQGVISIPQLIMVLGLGVGMSINQSVAFFSGLFPTKPIFVRTPKRGDNKNKKYIPPKSPIRWAEIAMGLYCLLSIPLVFSFKLYVAIPFLVLFGWGFLFIAGVFSQKYIKLQMPKKNS